MIWLTDFHGIFKIKFSRLDTIRACDKQTDGQTPHDGKDRTMQIKS